MMSMQDAVSIEGTLLMLDNTTPHVAVPVQAIRGGEVIATKLSDERGRYQFVNLKPGQYQLRCQVLGGYVYYQANDIVLRVVRYGELSSESSLGEHIGDFLCVENGKNLRNINFRFAQFKKGTWRELTYQIGLVGNYVTSIHRDPNGILWFGTGGGVSRYDGEGFTNLTTKDGLADNIIHAIHQDADGMIWFATWGGVSCYDGERFINLTEEDGLADNRVRFIYRDADGIMWFATFGGVSRYDGEGFENLTMRDGLLDNWVFRIYRDADGLMWFGTRMGASCYDEKEFRKLAKKDGLAENRIYDIHEDTDGIIWFATFGGVFRYDGNEFVNLTTKDGLARDYVYAIHEDADGVMWFGTWGGGVSRYDGKSFTSFTKKDGLVDNRVLTIYQDTDGVMWFGTEGGVSRYDTETFVSFTTRDGLIHDDISAIYHDCDSVKTWFGTRGGISCYDGKEFSNFTTKDGLVNNAVTVLHHAPDGALWCGTWGGGVSRYDGKSFTNFTKKDGLVDDTVVSICSEPDGIIWLGTLRGVSRYDGREFTNLDTEDGVPDNAVNALHHSSDGTLWLGTGRGVSCYDGESFHKLTTKDGLVSNLVLTVYDESDGLIWFGTHGGASRYDGKTFTSLTTEDGLAKNAVTAIYIDPEGKSWFGTRGGGVACYDGTAWTSLDTRDGLADNAVQCMHRDVDGSMWFGTEGGLTRYRPSAMLPKAQIVSVTADQTYTDLYTHPAFILGTRITIRYNSIDFITVPEKRQYRIRIKELDRNWRKPTKDTAFDCIFDKLGEYTFEVQAINRDLNYSEPASLSLTIEPDPILVSMQTELSHLRREVGRKYQFRNIIGRSIGIAQVRVLMERAIVSGLTVLISGETGTGKELVAKAIHHNSPRRDLPLLALNCGAVSKELISSTLFGHRKGAFTGAQDNQIGLFEAASGGTILLDEISEMPQDAQVHLLRVLEERKIQRLGDHVSRDVDVRIIAMTNQDLMKEVTAGRFREDLYYRLSVFPIRVPPLRERREDIPLLAEHFLREIDRESDGFASGVFEMLQSYSWPGNVRELRNVIHRAAALAESEIQTYHFPTEITCGESLIQEIASEQMGLSASVETLQRRLIENALRECNGNHTHAARMLKMHRSNFVRLIRRLGIQHPTSQ